MKTNKGMLKQNMALVTPFISLRKPPEDSYSAPYLTLEGRSRLPIYQYQGISILLPSSRKAMTGADYMESYKQKVF